ncbi:alpha-L-rhamnosidase [Nonomuraea deserti]|uniref:Alpha-L-rhamnosidase n=1 Tax=Nonomuraea deserti TaxID=1848322 RepID=A0A4R4VEU0_9ACTN|nr:glycosyl hydrolase [Nonomuraea deserti]TDD04058.1 alpha-L-rhamnosidase [Nonomuraea deserti]
MNDLTRRGFLLLGTAATALALTDSPAFATRSPGKAWLARPGRSVRPMVRWWWPDAHVDPAEIRREIDQLAAAGFGGAEIAAVHHSIRDKSVLDPAGHGWGTPAWNAAVEAALDQAARRGIRVDLTIGPSWPAAVPSITPDSPAAVKELAHGSVTVAAGATYAGDAPPPAVPPAEGVTERKLLLVQAARIEPAHSTGDETGLDPASVREVPVTGESVTWTAPADGEWVLISYWERGSGQRPESGPHTAPEAYVVDHFSAAGTRAVIDHWESELLTPAVRRLLRKAGGALFEDSIEIETDALPWTPGLLEEFGRRRGHPLAPLLPVVLLAEEDPVFAYEAAMTRHARKDYWDTISELFNEHHFAGLRDWAHSLGLKSRAQPYGLRTDAIAAAAVLDIPEGESLGFKNLDDYRCLAGGRDLAGHEVLSSEAGAYAGGAYTTTWTKLLTTMGGAYAAGLNQTVLHGFSYASAPGAAWPGFAAFTPYDGTAGYSESWGPRQPTWQHISDISGYFARVHQVLREGVPRADVAVLRQTGYTKTGIGASWFTRDGIPTGWTHQFVSGPLLDLPAARVSGGRLAPSGPAYKALFVEGDKFYAGEPTMTVPVAGRLLEYARAGLPIVLLGAWESASVPGLPGDGENERLREIAAALLAEPTVRLVADQADVPGALADLGVRPDARFDVRPDMRPDAGPDMRPDMRPDAGPDAEPDMRPATPSTLLTLRRVAGKIDYYYLCNGKHVENPKPPVAPIDHDVTLARADRHGIPYVLDPWTGRAERIALYTEEPDGIRLRVALQPGQARIVAIGRAGLFGDRSGRRPHATATDADRALYSGGDLAVRAAKAGTYTTALSTGRTVTTVIGEVPPPVELSSWRLEVEDWRPGATPDRTDKVVHELSLDALLPWTEIPELADVSGIGTYTTTVDLDGPAYLELGEVTDTCRVRVNGRRLDPVDQISPVVDAGPYLRRGTNTIEVEVATPLGNRLRTADPDVYGGLKRQPYGLKGPVRLLPYGEERVRT